MLPKMREIYIFLVLLKIVVCQRVAPGVPPQQYQQHQSPPQGHPQYVQPGQHIPMHQQQYEQIPVQHQQRQPTVQVQNHQPPPVPMQNHQQPPVPVQNHQPPPPPSPHHPAQNGHGAQLLNAANIAHEREHIAEHLSVPIDTSKMSEQELQFHYFKMHDADNNNKLDGCELIKSLIHWHEQGHKDPQNSAPPPGEKIFKDDELVGLIDPIFSIDDANNDGYIDYPEFVQAQQKAAAKH